MGILSPPERRRLKEFVDPKEGCAANLVKRGNALLRFDAGEAATHIASTLNMTKCTVYNWIRTFRMYKGMPLEERLGEKKPGDYRIREIEDFVEEAFSRGPQDYGYSEELWTLHLMQDCLFEHYEMKACKSSIQRARKNLNIDWPESNLLPDPEIPDFLIVSVEGKEFRYVRA